MLYSQPLQATSGSSELPLVIIRAKMWDALKSALNGNLPNIFVLAGIAFLAIAVIGEFTGKFKSDKAGRIGAAIAGIVLLVCGILLNAPVSNQKPSPRTANSPTATPAFSPTPNTAVSPPTKPKTNTSLTPKQTNIDRTESNVSDLQERIQDTQESLLKVPTEYTRRYSQFLKQPGTGLVKLLPRGKYDNVMTLRGAGAYYSFGRRSQEYGNGSDIELQGDGSFRVGFAGLDYGFFLTLGNIPIQDVPAHPETPQWAAMQRDQWSQMWNYKPPQGATQLRSERSKLGDTVPVQEAVTYLLRSISPDRTDTLTAIRVEKIDHADGSVIISWHLLASFQPPSGH